MSTEEHRYVEEATLALAESKEVQDRFNKVGITVNELAEGIKTEHEHIKGDTLNDVITRANIALDHLEERRDYYYGLAFVEKMPQNFWRNINWYIVGYVVCLIVILLLIMYYTCMKCSRQPENMRNMWGIQFKDDNAAKQMQLQMRKR